MYTISFKRNGKTLTVEKNNLRDAVDYLKTVQTLPSFSNVVCKTYSSRYSQWIFVTYNKKTGYINMAFKKSWI